MHARIPNHHTHPSHPILSQPREKGPPPGQEYSYTPPPFTQPSLTSPLPKPDSEPPTPTTSPSPSTTPNSTSHHQPSLPPSLHLRLALRKLLTCTFPRTTNIIYGLPSLKCPSTAARWMRGRQKSRKVCWGIVSCVELCAGREEE